MRMRPHGDDGVAHYWGDHSGYGAPVSWVLDGSDGLHQLNGPVTYTARDARSFQARVTRVGLDHLTLEAFAATPHHYARSFEQIQASRASILTFVLLAEGRLLVESGDRAFELEGGGCVVVDSRAPVAYRAVTDVRILRARIPVDRLATTLRPCAAAVEGPLERTPLVDGFIAFGAAVLKAAADGRTRPNPRLGRAAAELQSAVLAEARENRFGSAGRTELQHRIEAYIKEHLADRDLGPRSVATGLGISLRHAHGTFNRGDRTIARVIRDRRLAAVAVELRTYDQIPDLDELAARFGFPGAVSLDRAFRARFGRSPLDYQRRGGEAPD